MKTTTKKSKPAVKTSWFIVTFDHLTMSSMIDEYLEDEHLNYTRLPGDLVLRYSVECPIGNNKKTSDILANLPGVLSVLDCTRPSRFGDG